MDAIVVHGGRALSGDVTISGAKNSVLKLMAASLLAPGTYTLENVPAITDVGTMSDLLAAMGVTDAGIFGDILCMRMAKRGVTALVTDGVMRDVEGVLGTGLPVWCDGAAAPPSVAGLTFVNWGEPIGCGGVAVFPDDIIVADEDGAVVIPQAFLPLILEQGEEQERIEAWIVNEVQQGAALPGLYPMNADTKARYEAWKKTRK